MRCVVRSLKASVMKVLLRIKCSVLKSFLLKIFFFFSSKQNACLERKVWARIFKVLHDALSGFLSEKVPCWTLLGSLKSSTIQRTLEEPLKNLWKDGLLMLLFSSLYKCFRGTLKLTTKTHKSFFLFVVPYSLFANMGWFCANIVGR